MKIPISLWRKLSTQAPGGSRWPLPSQGHAAPPPSISLEFILLPFPPCQGFHWTHCWQQSQFFLGSYSCVSAERIQQLHSRNWTAAWSVTHHLLIRSTNGFLWANNQSSDKGQNKIASTSLSYLRHNDSQL